MNTQISNESPKVFFKEDRLVTTSRAVAEYFDKQHQHVTQKIESLDCSPEFTSSNFSLHVERQVVGVAEREIRYYELTKDGFMFLVMGFTGKKAAHLKEAYIAKFNAMESELRNTGSYNHQQLFNPIHPVDYANRIELIYHQDFKAIFCRTLQPGEVVITHESMMDWLRCQGMVFFTREELKNMRLSDILAIAG